MNVFISEANAEALLVHFSIPMCPVTAVHYTGGCFTLRDASASRKRVINAGNCRLFALIQFSAYHVKMTMTLFGKQKINKC